MAAALKILFVCTGNTCRSVFAQYLLKKFAKNGTIESDSAGISANPQFPIPSAIPKLLSEEGIGHFEHAPKQMDAALADWADYIFVMEDFHKDYVIERFPQAKKKVFLMKEFAYRKQADETQQITFSVPDPIGSPEEVYRRCFKEIKTTLQKILEVLPHD